MGKYVVHVVTNHIVYLWELLLLQVLCDGRLEVHGVAFVCTVDVPSILHLHIFVCQDELPDRLASQETTHTFD